VLRDRRPRDAELRRDDLDDLAGRVLVFGQQFEDAAPGLVPVAAYAVRSFTRRGG
jgi:hypothetical protein